MVRQTKDDLRAELSNERRLMQNKQKFIDTALKRIAELEGKLTEVQTLRVNDISSLQRERDSIKKSAQALHENATKSFQAEIAKTQAWRSVARNLKRANAELFLLVQDNV